MNSGQNVALQTYQRIGILVLAWTLPILWILAIPQSPGAKRADRQNRSKLHNAHALIQWFRAEFGEVPESLTELRAYSRFVKKALSAYDAYGEPLQYVRLDSDNFLLRSFGSDGNQNTVLDQEDQGLVSWNVLDGPAPTPDFVNGPSLLPYSPAMLYGTDSPNQQWHARIFLSVRDGARQLLVNHRQRRNLFMMARHDMVEEFLWLPSGYQIIYSATGSSRYNDGLYLWDLLEDRTINLLDRVLGRDAIGIAGGVANLWLSLSGFDRQRQTVYFFAGRNDGSSLDPRLFYAPGNLHALTIPADHSPSKLTMPLAQDVHDANTWNPPIDHLKQQLRLPTRLPNLQAKLLSLPLQGDIEPTILAWQNYCVETKNNAIFPYCLWYLSHLFNDAYRATLEIDKEAADRLRALGAEMSHALARYPLAPTYLKASALFTFEHLMQNRISPVQISRLVAPDGT